MIKTVNRTAIIAVPPARYIRGSERKDFIKKRSITAIIPRYAERENDKITIASAINPKIKEISLYLWFLAVIIITRRIPRKSPR
jgi:hypothetical protein